MGTNNIFLISHDFYNYLYVLGYVCKTFDHHIVHGLTKYNSKLITLFILVTALNYFPCSFILVFHNTSQAHFFKVTIFLCKNLKWNNLDIHKVIINIDCLFKLLDMTMWTYILLCEWPKLTLLLSWLQGLINPFSMEHQAEYLVRTIHRILDFLQLWFIPLKLFTKL